jgi:hypothetical protein
MELTDQRISDTGLSVAQVRYEQDLHRKAEKEIESLKGLPAEERRQRHREIMERLERMLLASRQS